jgi:N-acetylglucosamine kinase-like BadF-type ATPase
VGVTQRALLGVDGGNTKTDLLAATADGDLLAYLRGPGSNSHGTGGAEGCIAVLTALVAEAGLHEPAEHGVFFLCGADMDSDIAALKSALDAQPWVRSATVDNDTFALLRAGTPAGDAIAVVCGGGINCVGVRSDGRVARYPALGWETGDWGGSEEMGREALYHAARAEDGRGPETALVEIVREHFGLSTVLLVGEAVHYRRIRETRLGELAPAVVAAAADGDAVAATLVERLVEELELLVRRAVADLDLGGRPFDLVLGGGMLGSADDSLNRLVVARLADRVPEARPINSGFPPVAGAMLTALQEVGAPARAAERLLESLAAGCPPKDVRD